MRLINAGESVSIQGAQITAIACAHPELHLDADGRYAELSYVIRCENQAIFFGGDMMVREGLIKEIKPYKCSLMLLPCNGRDAWRDAHGIVGNMNSTEAAEFARVCNAKAFVPMHHDLYAINDCSEEQILEDADKAGVRVVCMKPMQTLELSTLLNKN